MTIGDLSVVTNRERHRVAVPSHSEITKLVLDQQTKPKLDASNTASEKLVTDALVDDLELRLIAMILKLLEKEQN